MLCYLAQPKEGQQPIKKKKNNQISQKIELNESPTTKELKEETFIHTGRRGRDGQLEQRGHAARQWLVDRTDETAAGRRGSPIFVCR